MNKTHKTPKEQIAELHTGIPIEKWEENNKKLDQFMKEKEDQKKKQEANDQIAMSMGYL